jgi:hypothetical protein
LAVLGSDEPEGTLVSSFDALGDAVPASLKNAIDHHSRPNVLSSRLTGE